MTIGCFLFCTHGNQRLAFRLRYCCVTPDNPRLFLAKELTYNKQVRCVRVCAAIRLRVTLGRTCSRMRPTGGRTMLIRWHAGLDWHRAETIEGGFIDVDYRLMPRVMDSDDIIDEFVVDLSTTAGWRGWRSAISQRASTSNEQRRSILTVNYCINVHINNKFDLNVFILKFARKLLALLAK